MRAAVAAFCASRRRLVQIAPTTLAGLAALASFLKDRSEAFSGEWLSDEDDFIEFFGSLDRSVAGIYQASPTAASAASLVASPSIAAVRSPQGPDPIFELIEAHRRAWHAFDDALGETALAEERFEDETGNNGDRPFVQCEIHEPPFYFSHGGLSPEEVLKNTRCFEARMTIRDVSSHEEIDKLLKPSDPERPDRARHSIEPMPHSIN